jgi:hypothetical protein
METESLKRLYEKAAEIAKVVPEAMQPAAFNRALDSLLQQGGQAKSGSRASTSQSSTMESTASGDAAETLLRDLDRTKYPGIKPANKVLPNALALLKAARDDHDLDGLTAPQVARVLTEKFRVGTTSAAVSMALGSAGDKVNRTLEGQAYLYRLMAPGEEQISRPDGNRDSGRNRRRGSKHKKEDQVKPARSDSAAEKTKSEATRAKTVRKPGPLALVTELIGEGFFATPRRLLDIQDHLERKRGVRLKPSDLSPTLVRLLRSGKLDRDRNDKGQYEYRAG